MTLLLNSALTLLATLHWTRFAFSQSSSAPVSQADLQRLISKIDNLNLKLDHFESRITQGLETSKLRMELISERIENLEERIPVRVKSELSRDLESKLGQTVRVEARRQYDLNANFFRRLSEEFADRVFDKVNSSILTLAEGHLNGSGIGKRGRSNSNPDGINTNKITNMFEEILRNSKSLAEKQVESDERLAKLNLALSNLQYQQGTPSPTTNTALSNSVLLEALASFETMSQTMSRRLTELNRSMQEKFEIQGQGFEIVSLALNMFLESCFRIQENQPLIEEEIAGLLDRILDTFHNSTRISEQRILQMTNERCSSPPHSSSASSTSSNILPTENPSQYGMTTLPPLQKEPSKLEESPLPTESATARDDEEFSKLLWQSLFKNGPNATNSSISSRLRQSFNTTRSSNYPLSIAVTNTSSTVPET